jgi:hypothetical protein
MFRWKDVARTPHSANDPLFAELLSSIDAAPIVEDVIPGQDLIFGDCDVRDGTIRYNAQATRVAVCTHELIHRIRGHWSETTVRSRTTRLLSSLSDFHLAAFNKRLVSVIRNSELDRLRTENAKLKAEIARLREVA